MARILGNVLRDGSNDLGSIEGMTSESNERIPIQNFGNLELNDPSKELSSAPTNDPAPGGKKQRYTDVEAEEEEASLTAAVLCSSKYAGAVKF